MKVIVSKPVCNWFSLFKSLLLLCPGLCCACPSSHSHTTMLPILQWAPSTNWAAGADKTLSKQEQIAVKEHCFSSWLLIGFAPGSTSWVQCGCWKRGETATLCLYSSLGSSGSYTVLSCWMWTGFQKCGSLTSCDYECEIFKTACFIGQLCALF